MAEAGGLRIVVHAKSAETVAYALRAYADMISRPAIDDVGPFRVDVWDGTGIVETTAKCSNPFVGRAAFKGTVRERGRYEVTLRSGVRIVCAPRAEGRAVTACHELRKLLFPLWQIFPDRLQHRF